MEHPHLSLIIPTYNEEHRLGATLETVIAYFARQPYSSEIIVVDDGSRDGTRGVFDSIRAKHPGPALRFLANSENRGKGAVVRQGMLAAAGEYVVFSDADLSTPIEELEKLLAALEEVDVAFGSRALDRTLIRKHQPLFRDLLGRFINLLVQLWVLWGVKDSQCGFKGFTRQAAQEIFAEQRVTSFLFDVEILFMARKKGYRCREIAVVWENDEASTMVPNLRNLWITARDIFRIRFLH